MNLLALVFGIIMVYLCQTPIMKKLYTLLCLSLGTFSLTAQDYIISPSNTLNQVIETNAYTTNYIYMQHDNTSANQINLAWDLIDIQVNPDWDYSYCDWTNCYAGNITTGTMTPIGQGQSGFLNVNLMAPSIGSGYFVFRVYKVGEEANADTLTYNFNVTLGLSDVELGKGISISPNPTDNGDFVVKNVLENSTITILNSLGQIIKTTKSSSPMVQFNDLNARNGLYFVRLERNGEIYATRRVIIK